MMFSSFGECFFYLWHQGVMSELTTFVSSHDGVEDGLVDGSCQDAAHRSAYWGQLTDRSKPADRNRDRDGADMTKYPWTLYH
jgi:hypothetical protein